MKEDHIIKAHIDGFKKRHEDCFKLENWRVSDSYKLIKKHCRPDQIIFEVGCLTGHHLILLSQEKDFNGSDMFGIDFVPEAIEWAEENSKDMEITFYLDHFPIALPELADRIILFDVIEHVHNQLEFMDGVINNLSDDGEVLILVPRGREYFDPGHINFYPDAECLKNFLVYYFDVIETVELEHKIFARCKLK